MFSYVISFLLYSSKIKMATTTDFDYLYKVLLIGDARVGKTSFLTRYTKNVVNKNPQPTIGVEYSTKSIILKNGSVVKAQIWDTSGSERYKSITTAHYRKSVGALLFFDLTDRTSFENTISWLKEIKDHTEEGIVVMLIGNKYDLVTDNPSLRTVSREEAEKFAKTYNLNYMETSAKTGYNVKESFEFLVETIYEELKKYQTDQEVFEKHVQLTLQQNPGMNKQEKNNDCCS